MSTLPWIVFVRPLENPKQYELAVLCDTRDSGKAGLFVVARADGARTVRHYYESQSVIKLVSNEKPDVVYELRHGNQQEET